ncbi:MAG: glycosyltransferase [candidate division SR1 bacterium]|nr:glycosyltransferase [candidate division SR1 bacterium]
MPFKASSLLRIICQFLLIPIKLLFCRNSIKIFYDEGRLPILFYPIKNVIFIIHDVRNYNLTTKHQNFLQRIYFKIIRLSFNRLNKADQIVTPSVFTKTSLISLGLNERKISVIANIIDQNVYRPLDVPKDLLRKELFEKYSIGKDNLYKKVILYVGSEEDRKNIVTILKSLSYLDDYLFIKIGNPIILENRQKHIAFIEKYTLNCIFIDNIYTDEDIVKFYNIADVFVFPSLFEGFGRPPIEAQASGCPVISSNNSGLKEVVGDSVLILKDPLDEKELYQKINLILHDYELKEKIIALGYENAKQFILDTNICKWRKILQKEKLD